MSEATSPQQWSMRLPLDQAAIGESVFCPLEPSAHNDALLQDWECPLLWKWVSSRLKIDDAFEGSPALRFNFARRTPPEVWKTNWSLWYDTALTSRIPVPADVVIRTRLTFEEVTTGFGSDNNTFVRPWTGIIARMVDLRRYYFLCLEYPDFVCLYRREDNNWTCLARRSADLDPFSANTLELRLRGQYMEACFDDRKLFAVADYAYAEGALGMRANTESFVTDFSAEANPSATKHFHSAMAAKEAELREMRESVPQPVVENRLHIDEATTPINLRCAHFTDPDTVQIFYTLEDSGDKATGVLRTLEGEELWRYHGPILRRYFPTTPHATGLSHIVGFSDDAVVLLDGRTGKLIQQRRFASLPNPPRRMSFLPDTMADLSGRGSRQDFLFTCGANDPRIWALGPDFSDIWQFTAGSGMGHSSHVAVADVNSDGLDEVFAGGSLIAHDGSEIWRQSLLLNQLKAPNAGHVDMTQMGFLCSDPSIPVVHMEGSSAGHLVADARDGSTLIEHAQGHVQGGCAARFVPGRDDLQVAASCRHGNYGILAIYSGDGQRISRFQPDFRTDCPRSINWDGSGTELLLIANDPARAALFDWSGRPVVPLQSLLSKAYRPEIPNKHRDFIVQPIGDDPRDCLLVRIGNEIVFIRPNGNPPKTCYAPSRHSSVSSPGWVSL